MMHITSKTADLLSSPTAGAFSLASKMPSLLFWRHLLSLLGFIVPLNHKKTCCLTTSAVWNKSRQFCLWARETKRYKCDYFTASLPPYSGLHSSLPSFATRFASFFTNSLSNIIHLRFSSRSRLSWMICIQWCVL